MLTFRASIANLAEAERLLDGLRAPDLSGPLEAGAEKLAELARPYPPERPGQRYTRTYALRDAWAPVQPAGSVGGVENTVAYAPYVVGNGGEQAEVHRTRWRTQDTIAEDAEAAVVAAVEARLGAALPR